MLLKAHSGIGYLFVAELEQRRDVVDSRFPYDGLIHLAVVVGDQVSHCFHRPPLDSMGSFFKIQQTGSRSIRLFEKWKN